MPKIDIEVFISRLYARHGDGLAETLASISDYNISSRARHGLAGGSTGTADCGFLYLLVKEFRRRTVFEIGTYVGTSAVAMQSAGASVVTCDPTEYGGLPTGLRFLKMDDVGASQVLKSEGTRPDMVFADWPPSVETILTLNDIGSEDMIFAVHDYLPGDKGEIAVRTINRHDRRAGDGTWLFPPKAPVALAPGVAIDAATAVLIPNRLLKAAGFL